MAQNDLSDLIVEHFPGAIPADSFVAATSTVLGELGFVSDNTIACIGMCRDELTRPAYRLIQDAWGMAFNMSSLGGLLLLGETGFRAAAQHAPRVDGRERHVYYAMPHIAICEGIDVGSIRRQGRDDLSGACGVLMAFRQELETGTLDLELRAHDLEQSLLKQHLFGGISYGSVPTLVEMTYLAHQRILRDLRGFVSRTVDTETCDYAYFTGVLIHTDDGENLIWPGPRYCELAGSARDIDAAALDGAAASPRVPAADYDSSGD